MKTLGEKRVRADFNVSANSSVDEIKHLSALLIDKVEEVKQNKSFVVEDKAELFRLSALAQTAYEEAAMWAVKAATL